MSDAAPAKRNSNDGPVELADDAWCAEKPITTGAWPVVVTKRPGTSAGFKHYGSRRGCCEEPLEICGSIESSDSEETLALEDDWTDTPETGGMLAIEDDPMLSSSVSMLQELLKAVTTFKNYYRPLQIMDRDRIRRRTRRLQLLNKRPSIEGDPETRRSATLPNEVYESRADKPGPNATRAELVSRCAMFYLRAEWSQLNNEEILDMIEYVQSIAPKFRTLHERIHEESMENKEFTTYTEIMSNYVKFWSETAFQIGLFVGSVDNNGTYVYDKTFEGPVAIVQDYVGSVLDRVHSGIAEPLDDGFTIGTVIDQFRIDEFLAFCRNVNLV